MTKNGNSITTNLMMQVPTDEKNGVEITIKNITDVTKYIRALDYIIFFPNVYIDINNNSSCNNDVKFKRYKYFAAADIRIDHKILLGNVLYHLDVSQLSIDARRFIGRINYSGIVIKFDIGELNITPNRENIIYTKETIAKIEDRIFKAKEEIESLAIKKSPKDITNLLNFYKIVNNGVIYNPVEDNITINSKECKAWRDKYYVYYLKSDNFTFKGSIIQSIDFNIISSFFYIPLPNYKGYITKERFYNGKLPSNLIIQSTMKAKRILMLLGNNRLTAEAKSWLRTYYSDYSVITEITLQDIYNHIYNHITNFKFRADKNIWILHFYEYLKSIITPLNVYEDKDFIAYKEELKGDKPKRVILNDIILYRQRDIHKEKIRFYNEDSVGSAIKWMKKFHKGIILSDLQDTVPWNKVANIFGYISIKAKTKTIEELEKRNLSFIVNKEKLITEDPLLIKYSTILKNLSVVDKHKNCRWISMYYTTYFRNMFPAKIKEVFTDICKTYNKLSDEYEYTKLAMKCTVIDPYYDVMCKKFIKYWNEYIELRDNVTNNYSESLNPAMEEILGYILMKNKVFRPDYKYYMKLKNNKIIQALCKK